jgi:hypothetical protein
LVPNKNRIGGLLRMNDKERFILAEKIQKKVQENLPDFQLIKKRDDIEKQLKETGNIE